MRPTFRRFSSSAVCIVLLAVASAACGGAIDSVDTTKGAAPAEPGAPSDSTPTPTAAPSPPPAPAPLPTDTPPRGDQIVVPSDATLTFRSKGGFAANTGDTSSCTLVDDTFTFEVATNHLTWKLCRMNDAFTANEFVIGSRTLSASQTAPLRAALAAVRIVQPGGPCAADKPAETLEIASPTALTSLVLHDVSDLCFNKAVTHATGLDDVQSELAKLLELGKRGSDGP